MNAKTLPFPIMNTAQAAAYLKVRPETVRNFAEDDLLPCRKACGVWFFNRWELIDWFGDPEWRAHCQED